MKSNLFKLLALLVVVASLSGCSKSSTSKSKTELLTQAGWKITSTGIDADKNGTVDSDVAEACEKDNTLTFAVGGTGLMEEGATKCDPTDPQTAAFAWQLKNGEKDLEFEGETFTILVLSDTQLKLYYEFDAGGGTMVRVVIILTH
jgi:hypothetical protein